MLIDPCPCARNREAAMSCPREVRGRLFWGEVEVIKGQPVGFMTVATLDGEPEPLTFGHEWLHVSERVARDHARIRHLEFVVA